MRAVDTNVLVRLMTRDNAKQVATADAFVANGAWVPHLAIAEATWVLASVYDRTPETVATAFNTSVRQYGWLLISAPGKNWLPATWSP